jgi:hypothetical protein
MRYLRKFNENMNDEMMKLQEFCDDHLAYLKDYGFRYKVESASNTQAYPIFRIVIEKYGDNGGTEWFKIHEIDNELLQFIEYLSTQYTILPYNFKNSPIGTEVELRDTSGYFYNYTIDDMLNNTGDYLADESYLKDTAKITKIEIPKVSHIIPKNKM